VTIIRISTWIMALFIMIVFFITPAQGGDETQSSIEWMWSPQIGYSPYIGILGAEIQKSHIGVTFGVPESIGVRYYFDDQGYSWFLGAHASYYPYKHEETKDGIQYDKTVTARVGLGFGYKWRWMNHWEIAPTLSVGYKRDKLSGDYGTRTDNYIVLSPGVSAGYTF
jgi:hypothetical protein